MHQGATDDVRLGQQIIDNLPVLRALSLRAVDSREPGMCSMTMPVGPATTNSYGAPHGGAIATLVDCAGGFLASRQISGRGPTADIHIRYLDTPTTDWIRADARIVRAGRRLIIIEVLVVDGNDRLLALATLSVAPIAPKEADTTPPSVAGETGPPALAEGT